MKLQSSLLCNYGPPTYTVAALPTRLIESWESLYVPCHLMFAVLETEARDSKSYANTFRDKLQTLPQMVCVGTQVTALKNTRDKAEYFDSQTQPDLSTNIYYPSPNSDAREIIKYS